MTKSAERLRFQLVPVPGGHGADDYEDDSGSAYTLRAFGPDGRPRGQLDFNLKVGPQLWVRWIEVEPAFRRRGVAGALLEEAQRRFPQALVDTGGLTDEGETFWAAHFPG